MQKKENDSISQHNGHYHTQMVLLADMFQLLLPLSTKMGKSSMLMCDEDRLCLMGTMQFSNCCFIWAREWYKALTWTYSTMTRHAKPKRHTVNTATEIRISIKHRAKTRYLKLITFLQVIILAGKYTVQHTYTEAAINEIMAQTDKLCWFHF